MGSRFPRIIGTVHTCDERGCMNSPRTTQSKSPPDSTFEIQLLAVAMRFSRWEWCSGEVIQKRGQFLTQQSPISSSHCLRAIDLSSHIAVQSFDGSFSSFLRMHCYAVKQLAEHTLFRQQSLKPQTTVKSTPMFLEMLPGSCLSSPEQIGF
jgi:hypothetical protein